MYIFIFYNQISSTNLLLLDLIHHLIIITEFIQIS